ncbi:MAG: DsbE family thiol:disulfide interchange protein [Pseudoruegeria sp.]
MAKVSPLMVLPPVLFAGLATLFLVGMQRENPNALPSAQEGKPAPMVVLEDLGEAPAFTDETLRQPGVKLVNYWASWCGPCRVEHPALEALAQEGVPIYGINYKDRSDDALGFLAELGNPYAEMGSDRQGRMALNWGVYGVPETYVIDGDGVVVLRFAGPITERVMKEYIRPAMEQATQP